MPHRDPDEARRYWREKRRQYRRERPEYEVVERLRRKTRRRVLIELFKDVPCADCSAELPSYCMDFHHRDPATKEINGALLWNCSVERLLAEVEKCDVICANCHRARHHRKEPA